MAGRPSKFKQINLKQLEILAKKGFTDAEMASFFEVTEQTFNNYKKEHPEFFESLKSWKQEADEIIEKSLFERAKGYSHPEDKILVVNGKVQIIPTRKFYPPDATSMIFWLKNRQPEQWKEKPEGNTNDPIKIEVVRVKRANDSDSTS